MKKKSTHSNHRLLVLVLFTLLPLSLFSNAIISIGLFSYSIGNDTDTVSVFGSSSTLEGNIIIPDTVTFQGKNYCVTAINKEALQYQEKIESIELPKGLTTIEEEAFYHCSALTRVVLPKHVSNIEAKAFAGCSALKEFYTPENSLYLSTHDGVLFDIGMTQLLSYPMGKGGEYTLPAGVKSIAAGAFYNYEELTKIVLPTGLTTIGSEAFMQCKALTDINLPNGLTHISERAFYDCDSLKTLILPDGLTTIGSEAFANSGSIKSVTFPNGLTTIGNKAFQLCSGLEQLTLPDGLTTLGDEAFSYCRGLISVTLPNSLTTLPWGAFNSCEKLANVTLPEGLTTIGGAAFSSCFNLTEIALPEGLLSIEMSAFNNCDGFSSIIIPNGVTTLGSSAFYDCDNLKVVTLPESLTTIGTYAFRYCYHLSELYVGNTTPIDIEANTFWDTQIQKGYCTLYVPQGSKEAYEAANGWKDFKFIEEMVAPSSVVFTYTLNSTDYTATITGYDGDKPTGDLIIPSTIDQDKATYRVTAIGYGAFAGCSGLTTLDLPQSITTLGDNAFSYCEGLTTLTLPEGLTTLGSYTFLGCKLLKSLYLPLTLTSSGKMVFAYCTALEEVHAANPRPLSIWSCTFMEVSKENCTLYVPTGSQSLYANAFAWQDFQNIEEEVPAGTINTPESGVTVRANAGRIIVEGAPEGATIAVYTLSGQLIACTTHTEIETPQRGIYIVRVGGVSFKINV